MAEPEAEHDGMPVFRRLVELVLGAVCAPGAKGVAAYLLKKRLRAAAAAALDEIRPAVERETPCAFIAFDLDDRGEASADRATKTAESEESTAFMRPLYLKPAPEIKENQP
ncbi:MAG: hypothetical protein IJ829_05200 [Kiritimatiellae bacterium]|nr:hypothetical protein [Kiritimatiellia bacterium]